VTDRLPVTVDAPSAIALLSTSVTSLPVTLTAPPKLLAAMVSVTA